MSSNIFWSPTKLPQILSLVPLLALSTARAQNEARPGPNSSNAPISPPNAFESSTPNTDSGSDDEQSSPESNELIINSPADLISLEYRNAPFIEVIRTLADAANLNITLSPEVERGSPVSIRLTKVTYDQALKAILETYKFGSVFENGILKIDTVSNLTALREERIKEKELSWKALPSKRLVWQVNYAKADALAGLLRNMLKAYAADPRFSITADTRTNKLIIEGIADALIEAKGILENLDKRKQQVLIEARIVEASSDLAKTLNITWGTRFGLNANRGLSSGILFPNSLSGNIGGAGALGTNAPSPGSSKNPAQLGTMQFTIGSINNLINIDGILRAYETESLANVIASPRIVVQDQEAAMIQENVSLQRGVVNASGGASSKGTAANLSLNVKPQVTSDNTLELDIQVERQTPTNAASDPVQGTISRSAKTKLIVGNGETAVIGGLYQTQKFKGQARIPFLGRLPIIGFLFRTNEEQSFRSELMVLITPRILPNPGGTQSLKADLPSNPNAANNFSIQNAKNASFTENNSGTNKNLNNSNINESGTTLSQGSNQINNQNNFGENNSGNPSSLGTNNSAAQNDLGANNSSNQMQSSDNSSNNGFENNTGNTQESNGAPQSNGGSSESGEGNFSNFEN